MQGATLIFPVVGYFNSLSILAQTSATLRFCDSVPANVAQPPFSINESCFHESISFSSAKVALASVARWNLSTQIGARAATTALSSEVFRNEGKSKGLMKARPL
jgi:hypothetical protein